MRIARLAKIKRHRVFRDFVWQSELPPFAQFNIIYGWNGSGKTTFSSLFENLQERQAIKEGEVEFELDNGKRIAGSDIPSANVPTVRVFNRNFVARTIEATGECNVAPIYFVGAESIAQQKLVESLKIDLAVAREAMAKANGDKKSADKAFDDFCIEKAKFIKEALLGSPEHANYDKRRFRQTITKIKGEPLQPKALSDEKKGLLRKQKELQAKPSIPKISISILGIEQLRSQALTLLKQSIVSKIIEDLACDAAVGTWVQQGLSLHKGGRETDTCRFCGSKLSSERRAELEAHYNDAFAFFQQEIEQTISEIERQGHSLERIGLPDESRFYDHLIEEIRSAIKNTKQAIKAFKQGLDQLKSTLDRKKATPFESLKPEDIESATTSFGSSLSSSIDAINIIIDKHELITGGLNDEIKQACLALEQDYVLEALPKLDELSNAVTEAETVLADASRQSEELQKKIAHIEIEIVEHRRPAEELNRELRAYLGRDELKFDVKDTGYTLSRNGQSALHLSEGERTAISFLYFLKSLEDKAFNLSEGIVVIDDPVSSLDANALFSAFGYMKERTKACHQLFILTHNFAFFRQVKNWFHHLKGQKKKDVVERPGRFYALWTTVFNGERGTTLSRIDPLLEKFESEYHFLFRRVHDVANSSDPAAELAQFYGMPNVARRLMETFLAYRFPDCDGDLVKRFERVDCDPAKKTRILRLLNTYSHSGGISDPEHDPSILAETQEVMKAILEILKALDQTHYQGMIKLMTPVEAEE
jgi:wobble nucleotide-excising tRNase